MPINFSDTAAISQDGSSLELIAPIAGRRAIFRMQVAEGCGMATSLKCGRGRHSLLFVI